MLRNNLSRLLLGKNKVKTSVSYLPFLLYVFPCLPLPLYIYSLSSLLFVSFLTSLSFSTSCLFLLHPFPPPHVFSYLPLPLYIMSFLTPFPPVSVFSYPPFPPLHVFPYTPFLPVQCLFLHPPSYACLFLHLFPPIHIFSYPLFLLFMTFLTSLSPYSCLFLPPFPTLRVFSYPPFPSKCLSLHPFLLHVSFLTSLSPSTVYPFILSSCTCLFLPPFPL